MLYIHHKLASEEINNLPIKKTSKFLEDINKHVYVASIYRTEHFYEYEWNSADIVDTFLETAKLLIDSLRAKEIIPSKQITVSVSFTIVNKDTTSRIIRYLPVRSWTTAVFRTSSLNEVIMESLSSQIKSKIIQNGESSSHILFSHFKSFQMTVSDVTDEDVLSIFGGDELLKVSFCINILTILAIIIPSIISIIVITILIITAL